MFKLIRLWFFMLCGVLSLAAPAELRIVAGEVPPFVREDKGHPAGVATDIVREMASRVGHSGRVELQPFARMIETGKAERGVLLIPVGRIPAREAHYRWVVNLVDEAFVLISKTGGKIDPHRLDKARRVGVMRDSVGERLARDSGFRLIEGVTREEANALKLASGRIDLWMAAWNTALQAQRAAGLAITGLNRGMVTSRVGIYLAASRDVEESALQPWRQALADMKQDGTYQLILASHGYELPR
ncbi:ABC transporter substrate-binding protein [Chitinimonas sp. BJYL2]|uniref:substrate-binding periplasmic protein n=1 Tax=Chitinimonas sp. BJYL2 TaxID=2976696 RepID=UPI0022B5BCBC|nr:ABC transporter substrate-binding protein [Chitinimonas sp. BJYL2]